MRDGTSTGAGRGRGPGPGGGPGDDGAPAPGGPATPRWALSALATAVLLPSLGVGTAGVALPDLSAAFGASFAAVQWVTLAYLTALTALVVSAGRLGCPYGSGPPGTWRPWP
ncbi:hypothetical protein [Streptomyces sp. NPDC097619]|uniref:hypothetical protein n=1 Tax=Streptomyces sp. NPDC097619 TaxID=3157228 RepID=UPI00331B5D3E